jgi:hypothetical protein
MRKKDKKDNFKKVNILVEQRYLFEKGIISESFNSLDGTPVSEFKKGDKIMWVGDTKTFPYGEPTKYGDIGEYLGQDDNGHAVTFSKVMYTSQNNFKKV